MNELLFRSNFESASKVHSSAGRQTSINQEPSPPNLLNI